MTRSRRRSASRFKARAFSRSSSAIIPSRRRDRAALDDREMRQAGLGHPVHDDPQRLVRVGHGRLGAGSLDPRTSDRGWRAPTQLCRSTRVTTPASGRRRRRPDRAAAGRSRASTLTARGEACRMAASSGKRDDVGPHHLAHEQDLERIDGVLAAQVEAAARDLLGQDRAPQHQHGEAVRDRHRDQQRQQHVDVVGQLEREDDAGERRAHRAAEDRAHADQRPEAGALDREAPSPRGRRARRPSSAAARARRPTCPSRATPPR